MALDKSCLCLLSPLDQILSSSIESQKSLGVASCPSCQSLFLKKNKRKICCSDKCRYVHQYYNSGVRERRIEERKNNIKIKNCLLCDNQFKTFRSHQKFCSEECVGIKERERKKEYARGRQLKNPEKNRKSSAKWRKNNLNKIKEYKSRDYVKERAKQYQKDYYEINKQKIRVYEEQWRKDNVEKSRLKTKKWQDKNKDHTSLKNKLFRKNNPEYHRKHREDNREDYNKYHRKWKKFKYHNDINYRLITAYRNRTKAFFKGIDKSVSTMKLLGCSRDELRLHLESKFTKGMTLDNHGSFWEIDHDYPLSKFINYEHLLKLCNWRNLQPLEIKSNREKGAKLDYVL